MMKAIQGTRERLFGGSFVAVLSIAAAIFIGWQGSMAVPVQIGALIDGLGYSEQRAGFLGSVEITAVALVAILLATRIGVWSKPRVALVGLAFVVVGQLLSASVSDFNFLVAFRLLVGIGAGLIYGAACSCIAGLVTGDKLFGWGMGLGQLLIAGMLFGLPYTMVYGYHEGVFTTLAILALAFGTLLFRLPDGREAAPTDEVREMHANVSMFTMILFMVALTLFNISIGMLWGFVERRADELQMDPAQVGLILAALPVGGTIGGIISGVIGGRFGRLRPLLLSLLGCAVSCSIVAIVEFHSAMVLAILSLGVFELFAVAFMIGTASKMDDVGRMSTIAGGAILLTYGLGPWLGGFLTIYISVSAICLVSAAFSLAAAFFYLPAGLALDRGQNPSAGGGG